MMRLQNITVTTQVLYTRSAGVHLLGFVTVHPFFLRCGGSGVIPRGNGMTCSMQLVILSALQEQENMLLGLGFCDEFYCDIFYIGVGLEGMHPHLIGFATAYYIRSRRPLHVDTRTLAI